MYIISNNIFYTYALLSNPINNNMQNKIVSENNQNGRHANESFRFVQLSDLHLSTITAPNPLKLFNKRILGYLSWLRRRRHTHQKWVLNLAIETIKQLQVDHYVITGDLTHIGLKHEFEQAACWLTDISSPQNITLIPGNHDLYINEHWANSFGLWEDYLYDTNETSQSIPTDDALMQLNSIYPTVRLRENIAFIGLNSVFDAPWFRATGKIDKQVLNRLKNILCEKKLDTYFKVLLIHHPITLTNTSKRKSLLNHEDIISLLAEHPVNLVLHGHGHHSCTESIICDNNFQIPVIGASSSSSTSQKPSYQAEFLIFDVIKNTQHWELNKSSYTLDMNKKAFYTSQEEKIIRQNIVA